MLNCSKNDHYLLPLDVVELLLPPDDDELEPVPPDLPDEDDDELTEPADLPELIDEPPELTDRPDEIDEPEETELLPVLTGIDTDDPPDERPVLNELPDEVFILLCDEEED